MKLYLVGLGPGNLNEATPRALTALEESDCIVGYTVYIDLIRERFSHKNLLATPMRHETDRCRMSVEEAAKGQTVSMVCSGDAGIYGMAGLVYQIASEYPPIEIEVIPGVTAAVAGAAVLGAPLMHDFVVISLSDLLTPLELIQKRLEAAAMADFVICLYNPSSKKRADYLKNACDLVLKYRSPQTITGFVKNIGRKGEKAEILQLSELREAEVDMFTTVFIGNSQTIKLNGKMITPRGYKISEKTNE